MSLIMIKKNCIYIAILMFLITSCKKDDIQEPVIVEDSENLTLNGAISVINANDMRASAFKVQLIEGQTNQSLYNDDYTWPNAQVFFTESKVQVEGSTVTIPFENNGFQFKNLKEQTYTLRITKKGYKAVNRIINVRKDNLYPISISMKVDENAGFTGKLQLLDENGENLSSSITFHRNTVSIFFYLFNGTGTIQGWNINCIPDGYIGKSFIINGEIVHLYSNWVEEIKPSKSGSLKPNEIKLIEVVIDPLVYTIKEHSGCRLSIGYEHNLYLAY